MKMRTKVCLRKSSLNFQEDQYEPEGDDDDDEEEYNEDEDEEGIVIVSQN